MAESQAPSVEPATEAKADGEAPQAPAQKEMKSVVLTGFGGLKMLKVQQKPEAAAGEGEVLVRVKACGMNFPDLMVRQGVIDNPPKTPVIMGFECAGIVEALGENTTGFKVGDRVIGFTNYNAWAELVNINANNVYKMPDNMSFQDGAALSMNYVTAYILLFDMANLRKGQSLLIHSVGGGVGHAVTQLCKTVEDVTVFGTASSHKHEAVKANVSHIFDHSADYAQEIRKVNAEGVDIVLDCMCGDDTNKGITLLKPMGKYILYGTSNIVTGETKSFFSFAKSWWQVDKVNPIKLFDENKLIGGFQLRRLLFNQGQHGYVRDVIEKLIKLYSAGKINPTIDSVWAFEDVSDAMQKMQDRKNIGKVLLDPSAEPKPKPKAAKPEEKAASESSDTKEEKKEEKPAQDGKCHKPVRATAKDSERARFAVEGT